MDRRVAAGLVVSLVLGACSSGGDVSDPSGSASEAVDAATSVADGDDEPLRCELVGYPCAWPDADPEVLQASQDLLVDAKERLDAGATAAEGLAAAGGWLADQPGVAEVSWDREAATGLMVRLEGGLPVFLETALAGPIDLDVLDAELAEGLAGPITDTGDGPVAQAPRTITGAPAGRVVAAGYRPPLEPGRTQRRAIVFDPYADVDTWRVEGRVVKDQLEQHPDFRGNVRYEKAPQVSDLVGLAQYDVVHIATHSSSWCDPAIEGPVEVRCFTQMAWGEWLDDDPLPTGVTPFFDRHGVFRLMVRSQYFRAVEAPDTILYLSSCESAGSLSDDVPPPLSTRFGAFIGWDEVALGSGAQATATTFWNLMVTHGLDVETAFERLEELDLHRTPVPVDFDNRWENAREWLGITPVAQLRHFGQNLRARDVVELRVGGAELTDGGQVDLAVESDIDDGIDELVEDVVLRVEGVKDGTEGAVTLELRVAEALPTGDGDRVTPRTIELTRGRAVDANDGGWSVWEVALDDVIVPFDLGRDDVDPDDPTEYVWEARVYERSTEYGAHVAEDVVFNVQALAEGTLGFFDFFESIPNVRTLENRVALVFPSQGGQILGGAVSIVVVESEDLPSGSFTGTWGGDLTGTYDAETGRLDLITRIEVQGLSQFLPFSESDSAGGAVTGIVDWDSGTVDLTFEFGEPRLTTTLQFAPAPSRVGAPPPEPPDEPDPDDPPPPDDTVDPDAPVAMRR